MMLCKAFDVIFRGSTFKLLYSVFGPAAFSGLVPAKEQITTAPAIRTVTTDLFLIKDILKNSVYLAMTSSVTSSLSEMVLVPPTSKSFLLMLKTPLNRYPPPSACQLNGKDRSFV